MYPTHILTFLSAVEELSSVHALSGDEQFIPLLVLVWITEYALS